MKSTLINMVAVLFTITLIASAGVGVVNMITEEPIEAANQAKTQKALSEVLPAFEQTSIEELEIDGLQIKVYTATKGEALAGYAVETQTAQGFNGVVKLMVGFLPDGTVTNVNVLEQAETPGLGSKMTEEGNPLLKSIRNCKLEEKKLVNGRLAVTKDGGDVDALTAATISSRAYVDAVNRAWTAMTSVRDNKQPADAASGATAATTVQTEEPAAREGESNE